MPLGIAMVFGLLVSQLLTLFTTPAVYVALSALAGNSAARPSQLPGATVDFTGACICIVRAFEISPALRPTASGYQTVMAKPASIKIRLNSTADTGFFYVTKKNCPHP